MSSAHASPSAGSQWRVLATLKGRVGGIVLDGRGHLFAVESFDDHVAELTLQGSVVAEWGATGSRPGQLSQPVRAAVDSQGNVYVTDSKNNRVRKFTADGKPLAQWGGPGAGPGQFNFPIGVAVDAGGDVFVSEFGNSRVQKLSPSGAPIAAWPIDGASDLALDTKGDVWVAEAFAGNYVHELSPSGAEIVRLGGSGPGTGQFNEPRGIQFDGQGDVFVGDNGNNRIVKLNPAGQFAAQWKGPADAPFPEQTDIALSPDGMLYVSDGTRILTRCIATC